MSTPLRPAIVGCGDENMRGSAVASGVPAAKGGSGCRATVSPYHCLRCAARSEVPPS
jgi:hypothetical protein